MPQAINSDILLYVDDTCQGQGYQNDRRTVKHRFQLTL